MTFCGANGKQNRETVNEDAKIKIPLEEFGKLKIKSEQITQGSSKSYQEKVNKNNDPPWEDA